MFAFRIRKLDAQECDFLISCPFAVIVWDNLKNIPVYIARIGMPDQADQEITREKSTLKRFFSFRRKSKVSESDSEVDERSKAKISHDRSRSRRKSESRISEAGSESMISQLQSKNSKSFNKRKVEEISMSKIKDKNT